MSDKMKYEPPKLIEFNEHIDQSKGACSGGSANNATCYAGVGAGGGCWADGTSASVACGDWGLAVY